jgi:hypothetical protein
MDEGVRSPYVMVPVPAEHLAEVGQFIIRTVARAAVADWDGPSLQQFCQEADEASRALLRFAAEATVAGEQVRVEAAAGALHVSARETLGILDDINEAAIAAKRAPLFVIQTISEELPDGRVLEPRIYAMAPSVARMLHDGALAAPTSSPEPLGE